MRLRLGRGLPRHNLQAVMDFEDFVYNRTDGTPQSVFKNLGDSGFYYVSYFDDTVSRSSKLSLALRPDNVLEVPMLTVGKIKRLCTSGVYNKAGKYKKLKSEFVSTSVDLGKNTIRGEIKKAFIYDQLIFWEKDIPNSPFNLQTIAVYCDCKYFWNQTRQSGFCCSHIIGQLRRVKYFHDENL